MKADVLTKSIFDKVLRSSSGYVQKYRKNKITLIGEYFEDVVYDRYTPTSTVKCIDGTSFFSPHSVVTVHIPYLLTSYKNRREQVQATKLGSTLRAFAATSTKTLEVEVNGRRVPDDYVQIVCCRNGTSVMIRPNINDGNFTVFSSSRSVNKVRIKVKDYRNTSYINNSGIMASNLAGGYMNTDIHYGSMEAPPEYLRIFKDGKLLPPCSIEDTGSRYDHRFSVDGAGMLVYHYDKEIERSSIIEIVDDTTVTGIYSCTDSNGQIIIPKGILTEDINVIHESQVDVYAGIDGLYTYVDKANVDRISHRILEVTNQEEGIDDYIIRVYDSVDIGNSLVGKYSDDIQQFMKFYNDDDLRKYIFDPGVGDMTLASAKEYYDKLTTYPEIVDAIEEVSHEDRVAFMQSMIRDNSNNLKNLLSEFSDHEDRYYIDSPEAIANIVGEDGHIRLTLRDTPGVDDTVFVMVNGLKLNQSLVGIKEGYLGKIVMDCDISHLVLSEINDIEIFIVTGDQKLPKVNNTLDANSQFVLNIYDIGYIEGDQWVVYLRDNVQKPMYADESKFAYHYEYLTRGTEYTQELISEGRYRITVLDGRPGDTVLAMNTRFKYNITYSATESRSSDRSTHRLDVFDSVNNEILPLPYDDTYRVDIYTNGKYHLGGVSMFMAPQGKPPMRNIAEVIYRHIPQKGDTVEIYFTGLSNDTYSAVEYIPTDNEMCIIRCEDLPMPYDSRYMTVIADGVTIPRRWVEALSDKTLKIWNIELPITEFGIVSDFKDYGVRDFTSMLTAYSEGDNILDKSIAKHSARYDYMTSQVINPTYRALTEILDNSSFAEGEWLLRNPIAPVSIHDIEFSVDPLINRYLDNVFSDKESKKINANIRNVLSFDEYAVYIPKNERLNDRMEFDANKKGIVATRTMLDSNIAARTPNELKLLIVRKYYKNLLDVTKDKETSAINANDDVYDVYQKQSLKDFMHAFEFPHKQSVIDANIIYGPEGSEIAMEVNANRLINLKDK